MYVCMYVPALVSSASSQNGQLMRFLSKISLFEGLGVPKRTQLVRSLTKQACSRILMLHACDMYVCTYVQIKRAFTCLEYSKYVCMYVQMNEVVFFTMQNMYVCKYICMYEYALHSQYTRRTIVQQTSDHLAYPHVCHTCMYVYMYVCMYV
jgi:hypothetical protein